MHLPVKKIKEHAKLPTYGHEGDAGADVYSAEDYLILPGKRETISTGVCLATPYGYVGLVWDKSGISTKTGVLTIAGVIDSTYRGEVLIALKNLGEEPFKIEKGMKVAQLLIQPIVSANFSEVTEIDETPRGEGGFGSTGKD